MAKFSPVDLKFGAQQGSIISLDTDFLFEYTIWKIHDGLLQDTSTLTAVLIMRRLCLPYITPIGFFFFQSYCLLQKVIPNPVELTLLLALKPLRI